MGPEEPAATPAAPAAAAEPTKTETAAAPAAAVAPAGMLQIDDCGLSRSGSRC